MAPIVNETDAQSAGPRNAIAAPAAQPVALEVSVTVNGARTVEGSDKREPFSETTKTVLIFAHGAVIRLASSVAPGQLLFLTNENSKKEVVCQVVKSKNYRNVSGYVELEFTEPAPNFWGMRFPGERSAVTRPVTATPPSASSSRVVPTLPLQRPGEQPTASPQASAPPAVKTPPHVISEKPVLSKSMPVEMQAPPPPAIAPVRPQTASVIDFPRAPENKPASFLEDPRGSSGPSWQAPVANAESLKQEAARLQEQLSSLLIAESAVQIKQEAPQPPKQESRSAAEASAKLPEIADHQEKPAPPAQHVKTSPPVSKTENATSRRSTLDLAAEELKIPAWLEPLARNTAPVAAPVPPPIEHAKPAPAEEPQNAAEEESISTPGFQTAGPAPTFGTQLFGERIEEAAGSTKSGKGLLLWALAAGLILAAAGGAWYFRSSHIAPTTTPTNTPTFATLPRSVPAPQTDAASGATLGAPISPLKDRAAATERDGEASGRTPPATNPTAALSAEAAKELVKMEASRNRAGLKEKAASEQQKKPILGDVQLAAPTVSSSDAAQQDDVAAPRLNLGNGPATSGDTGNVALLAGHDKQPTAPVPVGGDVKPARLLHSVPPAYPSLARAQHVSGDVLIDAFIDAAGHVTTMKVLSGPVLLHQAAMDALHQWRYQPAMLDDKPVAIHLTVKVQFRMQ
jgi:TonB family protein